MHCCLRSEVVLVVLPLTCLVQTIGQLLALDRIRKLVGPLTTGESSPPKLTHLGWLWYCFLFGSVPKQPAHTALQKLEGQELTPHDVKHLQKI